MIDFIGKEIRKGDTVVFSTRRYGLNVGIVRRLTTGNTATVERYWDHGVDVIPNVPGQSMYTIHSVSGEQSGLEAAEQLQYDLRRKYFEEKE